MIYEPDDMLTIVQAAAVLHLGTAAIRDACERGELPSIPKGQGTQRQHRNIRYGALMEWARRNEAESVQRRQRIRDCHAAVIASRTIPALPRQDSPYLHAKRTVGNRRRPRNSQ